MIRTRRGQGGAAVLILLIALLIILYVLFLPPAERAAILGETPTTNPGPTDPDSILLSVVPTQVDPSGGISARDLPSFTVRTRTSGNILVQRDAMTLERSVFHKEADTMLFDAPADAKNVLLSFTSLAATGELKVWLNGRIIYDNPLSQRQPPPIALQEEWLLPSNELVFEVSSPGFNFWQTNRINLVTVRVTADVTQRQEATQAQTFVLQELARTNRIVLEFIPECSEAGGRIMLNLNGELFYNGVPECGQVISLDVPFARVQEGENRLQWDVDRGEYYMSNVRVITEGVPQEYDNAFTVPRELQSAVVAQGKDIHLSLTFRSADARGVVVVNGNELGFRTRQQSFSAPITQFIRAGTNTVVVADSTKDVTLLEVFVR